MRQLTGIHRNQLVADVVLSSIGISLQRCCKDIYRERKTNFLYRSGWIDRNRASRERKGRHKSVDASGTRNISANSSIAEQIGSLSWLQNKSISYVLGGTTSLCKINDTSNFTTYVRSYHFLASCIGLFVSVQSHLIFGQFQDSFGHQSTSSARSFACMYIRL